MAETMISKNNTRDQNPENDAIINEILSRQRSHDPQLIERLRELTKCVHASWLFSPVEESKLLLRSLCRSLSSYPENHDSSWYHFGGCLDIDFTSLLIISNSKIEMDKAELCLRTFAQRKNSTLATIIDVLAQFQRYDALTDAEPFIENLVKYIHSSKGRKHWDPRNRPAAANYLEPRENVDSGFSSLHQGNIVDTTIRMKYWERLYLPTPLEVVERIRDSRDKSQSLLPDPETREIENYQRAQPITRTALSKQKKIILLTFASDGSAAAQRIAGTLRTAAAVRRQYFVLILDEKANSVMRNPECMIMKIFKKVNYVMPILTEGYLKTVKKLKVDPETTNALASFDERYAHFIYNLMCTEYSARSCLNYRFHCVVPEEVHYSSLSKELCGQPILRSWTNERDLDSFARKLLL